MTFKAEFDNVVTIEEKRVSPTGRITGLSKYKERIVHVVFQKQIDCDDSPLGDPYHYQAAIDAVYDLEVSGSDPTTEEVMEATQ